MTQATQRSTTERPPVNPLIAQLPAIGLILGVIVSAFVSVLFTLNIGMAMIFGVAVGLTAGALLRFGATYRSATKAYSRATLDPATQRNLAN